MSQLFSAPRIEHFRPDQVTAFEARLAAISRDTELRDVDGVGDLLLEGNGKTPRGSTYTLDAFRQACAAIASGLAVTVLDLCAGGRGVRPAQATGLQIFNAVLRQRFDARLSGRVRLLYDVRLKRIEAVLADSYARLENDAVYDMAKAVAIGLDGPYQFAGGAIVGRYACFRLRAPRPLARRQAGAGPMTFYGGVHVRNSEVSGQASVLVAPAVIFGDGLASVGAGVRRDRARAVHAGNKIHLKINDLLATAMAADAQLTGQRLTLLSETPLGLPEAHDERRRWIADLSDKLENRKVPPKVADSLAEFAQLADDGSPAAASRLAGRTRLDYYITLARQASTLAPEARLKVEAAAHTMLTGGLRPEIQRNR